MATKKAVKTKKSAVKAKPSKKPVSKTKPAVKKDLPVVDPTPAPPPAPPVPTCNVKCKRGSDPATGGQSCKSMTAENLTSPGSTVSSFRCTACKFTWHVPTGGTYYGY